MAALDGWLATAAPAPATLVHGDFHAGNVLSHGAGATVVDWTGAVLGDPGRDPAYCRYDLALANGLEVVDASTAAYVDAGGVAEPSAARLHRRRRRPPRPRAPRRYPR